jgi:putative Mg2+ transporter-C (MgtC) family protein
MPIAPDWIEIARRLALTLAAGILIGFNRWERGRAAGIRTTVLVCLAASVAMIQADLLLSTNGKTSSSFAVADVLRLPLGILCGMGFIGGGAILRKGRMITGVTTAATLWFVTVVGLCFGGGQLGVGVAATLLGLFLLWGLQWLERRLRQERLGTLTFEMQAGSRPKEELESYLKGFGCRVISWSVNYDAQPGMQKLSYEVRWRTSSRDSGLPEFVRQLSERKDLAGMKWREAAHAET